MNKEQIEKQYLLWNRGQRPTSLTTDFLSEAVDPIIKSSSMFFPQRFESSIIFFMSGGID
jgi:hypothetical protein